MTNAADALLNRLATLGVTTVFGIPGVDNLAFFEALDRSGARSVLVRHEATAGYAADAYFRVSGRPAVCFTTAGPGAANAVASMGEAWASGSGFLHMTTTVATTYGSTDRPRSLPHFHPRQIDLFRPLSKLALHCDDPAELADLGARCVAAMRMPPVSATYLEVPFDLLSSEVDAGAGRSTDHEPAPVPTASPDVIARAAGLLAGSVRPLIWAGSGSLGAVDDVIALAEALDAPVIITYSAKRRFSRADHPLVVAYPPHEPPVGELLESSDAVLVLGSDLDAMMTRQFALRFPAHLVHVDVEERHIAMNYPAAVAVVSTVEAAAPALLAPLRRGRAVGVRDGRARAEAARRDTRAGLADDGRGPLPERFLAALDAALPDDAVVVCDMTVPGYWTAGYLPLASRRQLLYPIGWGTLGFGLPAAIGAAVAAPHNRTLCVAGDAGFLYAAGELATVAEQGLSLTLVVVDDGGYGMLRYAANARFGRTFSVDLASPDFAAVGRAFAIPTWSASLDEADLPKIMREAVDLQGPSMVVLSGALVPPRMALLGTPWSGAAPD